MIIPSIDLMNGKAVQLVQGKKKVLEVANVLALAREFSKYGEIVVIDLDAALGKGNNLNLIKKICKIAECRVGGGIRTIEKAKEILQAGAKKIIIGTKANSSFLSQLPKENLIVAIDTKNGYITDKGWTNKTEKTPEQAIKELESYCSEFLFTDVDVEGMMKGCNLNKIRQIKEITKNKLTAAGGITTMQEIREIETLGINSQIGMALYTGKIKLDEAFVYLLDWKKMNNLVPTIVQDESKNVLMLAYSSKESLLKTLKTGKATYFSRKRKKLWTKGETSGNFQELLNVRYDCDRDALLFSVKQKGVACCKGTYSCFGEKEFSLNELYETIEKRIASKAKDSYSYKLYKNPKMLKAKILEEANELIRTKNKKQVIWEASDLLYFIIAFLVKRKVNLKDIELMLERRNIKNGKRNLIK